MPTSDTCRSTERRRGAGFTLIEMVVVLAIMALIIGVVAVRVTAMIDSWRARTELDSIQAQFAHLPILARQRGRAIVLPPKSDPDPANQALPPAITLPHSWLIRFDHPLRVTAVGFCGGATITLEHGDRRYRRVVLPPFCTWTTAPAQTGDSS